MTRTLLRNLVLVFVPLLVAVPEASADCSNQFSSTIVKYWEYVGELPPVSERNETSESLCDISTVGTRRICTVRLWGTLHMPRHGSAAATASGKYPTLIFNHGSEHIFGAKGKYCEAARFFVPKGYAVFVPFRRGQGDPDRPEGSRQSSGRYIEDVLDDFDNNPSHHHTTCTFRDCYKAELLQLEADDEVAFAAQYLIETAHLVPLLGDGEYKLAVGGNSYGGAVTVFFNRMNHGQAVAMPFAPGAQNWGDVDFAYAAQSWDLSRNPSTLLGTLLTAASHAKTPAFYLQAKWDYDTRATIDLAYAHAYSSSDPAHGNRFVASIFPYKKFLFEDGTVDYQSAHEGFAKATGEWGRSVLAFLRLYGVR